MSKIFFLKQIINSDQRKLENWLQKLYNENFK